LNSLNSNVKRKLLFGCLYFSEGAPIGFLWLAMPTRLRASGVPIENITWLTAILVLPWTFKFVWAPLIDLAQGPRWSLRNWIVTAQTVMGLTLLPLLFLNPVEHFSVLAAVLLAHAFAAATQDVAIDALCISLTDPLERGEINGWMQTGMLLGRALLGGGALVMAPHIGEQAVVGLLIGVTTFSMLLVLMMPHQSAEEEPQPDSASYHENRFQMVFSSVRLAATERNTWIGLAFALTGGAAFKALEAVFGPFLIDRQFTQAEVGEFAALPMIVLMVIGSLLGGWLSDRIGRRRLVATSLIMICVSVAALAFSDLWFESQRGNHLLFWLAISAIGIGLFTAASYALFMDMTNPAVAATQFSAFMGLTNGCESWSTWLAGGIIVTSGYPAAFLVLCGASLLSLPLLGLIAPRVDSPALRK
jgi:MFS family permease